MFYIMQEIIFSNQKIKAINWKLISSNLTNSKNYPQKKSIAAGAIAESKLQKGLLYFGTDRGLFWTSKNDGKTWKENSDKISDGYIRSIHPSLYKKGRVYMSMTGINYDDLSNYLYTYQKIMEKDGKN